ncbi:MAG TPA: PBP1A family penicillin-binding protein [Bauldia sp.]|nr:PBP1A family penicillin-binding protein [Bauldia sp.]
MRDKLRKSVRDPFQSDRVRRRDPALKGEIYADAFLFRVGRFLARKAEGISLFLRRLRPSGFARAAVEIAGDGLTLAAGISVILLALALPAFEATKTDWRAQSDYSVTFLDRYGNEIGKRGIRHSDSVLLEEMPDHFIKAVIATEDRRFFDHFGIDIFGTIRAMFENLRADAVVQGGSSLSQQLAKNLFLSNERTIERKIKEAFLALWLEANLSKQEILKLYLDRAYMGGGNFGVEAAAEFYFGKSIKDVNLAEAAMLAGLFKAPARYAPHVNLPAARARANEVLTNMVQAGFLTEGQVVGARRHPADVVERAAVAAGSPDYFLDWAFEKVKEAGVTGDRVLTVRTTIDMGLQRAAEESVEAVLRQYGESYRVSEAALVSLEPDGAVRTMVGGRDYGESQFNRAVDALRQPGSSFKPFVYATAMANGFTPKSVVRDQPTCIGDWCVHNYAGGYAGAITLTTAIVKSINTIPVQLAQRIGRDKIVDTAKRMGITTELRITRSLPIGSSEVTVLDMAGAYAAFANGGYRATPYAFTQILDSRGEVLFDRRRDVTAPPERVLDQKVVQSMNEMLVQVPEWGTGRQAKLDGLRTAGKTGTTSAYKDAWFVGFTGDFCTAVWFGNDSYASTRRLTGGTLPAMAWKRYMTVAEQGVTEPKPIPFIEPEEAPKPGSKATVAAADPKLPPPQPPASPVVLSPETARRLLSLEELLRSARPLKPVASIDPPVATPAQ